MGRNRILTWHFMWSYGDSNPGPLACHQQAARPPQYFCAGHRPRKYAPVPSSPHRLRYFPAVPASLPGQAPNERLTSQNLQELYRGALQGDQHPTAPDECRKAPAAVPGSGHDHRLSPTAASPRSELPATAKPFGRARVRQATAERPDLPVSGRRILLWLLARRYWFGSAGLLLRVKQVSSLVQQCDEVVEFAESLGDTFGEPLTANLEVQSRRNGGGDLRPKIVDLVEDFDQVGRGPRTDQALHIREFV